MSSTPQRNSTRRFMNEEIKTTRNIEEVPYHTTYTTKTITSNTTPIDEYESINRSVNGAMVLSGSSTRGHSASICGNALSPMRTGATASYGGGRSMVSGGHSTTSGQRSHSMVSAGGQRIVSTVRGEARETGETQIIASRMGEARFTGEVNIVSQHTSGSQLVGTTVVGIEKGAERQISVTEVAVGEEVIGEKTQFLGRGRRGKKVIREEVIEKVIIVPETIQVEEWVEDEYDMEETIVEVAKKIQIEKTLEIPEIEIVEKIIEQIETIVREKIIEVPKIETIEKIVEVPVIQTVEKIVEVPEIQYNDFPVEKIIEIPEYRTEEVIREVKRPNFIEKHIEQKKLIADARAHVRSLPVPVEAETIIEFTVPSIRANYIKKKFPVYLPRFIEVPVSRQFIEEGVAQTNEKYAARLSNLMNAGHAVSLCEIEKLASEYKNFENSHRLTQKKISSSHLDEQAKRTMFQLLSIPLEQHSPYHQRLPCEVTDLHIGQYSFSNLGSSIIYSSSQFGMDAYNVASSMQYSSMKPIAYSSTSGPVHHQSMTTTSGYASGGYVSGGSASGGYASSNYGSSRVM